MKYKEFGAEHGDTLLLLHGGGLSWWNYREAAELLQVSEEAIYAELSGTRRYDRRREEFRAPIQRQAPEKKISAPLRSLLELAVNYQDAARQLAEMLDPEEIAGDTPEMKALNMALAFALNDDYASLAGALAEMLIDTPSPEVSRALVAHPDYPDISRAVNDSVAELRRRKMRERRLELLEKLRSAQSDEEKERWFREIAELDGGSRKNGENES